MSRPTCPHCLRPQATCLCHLAVPIASACELLILQHPLEVHHAKNSARLLHLSVPGSRIVVGEAFDEVALQALLPGPRTTVLLYPPTAYEGHAAPALLEPSQLQHPDTLRLVVLDGTWRKSRKMLHQNPLLQQLPRLPLRELRVERLEARLRLGRAERRLPIVVPGHQRWERH